jgi:hypothetical protein
MDDLIRHGLLMEVPYGDGQSALFLTTAGVSTLQAIFGDELNQYYRSGEALVSLPKSSQLKINPVKIPHQMSLNEFALTFDRYAMGTGTPYQYFDDKMMQKAAYFMMPDAVIELPDRFLFLEMDMGTERPSYLAKKWGAYQGFLRSPRPPYDRKPIVMLFILKGVKNLDLRKKGVAKSLMTYLPDWFNGRFDVFLGSPEELHEVVESKFLGKRNGLHERRENVLKLLWETHGLAPSRPTFLDKLDYPIDYYIRSLNRDGTVAVEGGRPVEFLLDIWIDGRMSALRNVARNNGLSHQTREQAGRSMRHLVVLPNEKAAYSILEMIRSEQPKEIYFTTLERLEKYELPEALFAIDALDNLVHFSDWSLRPTVHERRKFEQESWRGGQRKEGGARRK